MKYIFLVVLCWAVGFALPSFTAVIQLIAALLAVGIILVGLRYYIDTRINAVRL
ncbi:hypothetical protein LEM8419_02606 [Neolewinella maritima]|uniref:Uncharacterized protein n=1 Tax=Neolewinella maritima TaxID=1383882 RepID=A0ABN8F420_9BACT|nr:hypothetical protein [Neolewinella maritima]CAH1001700.1 hypothetical protein LEM8419_02606 [Neolewinella maritima]